MSHSFSADMGSPSRARDARLRAAGMPRKNPERARAYERECSRREDDHYRYEYTPPVVAEVRIVNVRWCRYRPVDSTG